MKIQYELTFDDYRAAQRLHALRSFWSRLVRILTLYIYPVAGFIILLLGLSLFREGASVHTLFICGIVLVCCPLYLRIQLRRCYKRTRSGNGSCQLTFDEETIRVEGQYSKGEMDWKAIHSFREDAKVFLLYLAPAKFIAIPKRVCSEEQITELKGFFLQKVQITTQ